MKKILMFMVVCILSINAHAQQYFQIKFSDYGNWNTYTKQYEFGSHKTNHDNMLLTIKGNLILIEDKAKSYYITYGDPSNQESYKYNDWTWNATDEKGRECLIKLRDLKQETPWVQIYVIYDEFAMVYDYKAE